MSLQDIVHIRNDILKAASNILFGITLAALGTKSVNLYTNLFLCILKF